MRIRTLIVALLAATTLSTPVLAQVQVEGPGEPGRRERTFDRGERNQGGGNAERRAGGGERGGGERVGGERGGGDAPAPRAEYRAPRTEGVEGGGWRGRQQTGDATVAPAPVFRGGGSVDGGLRDGAGGGNGNWRGERRNGEAVAVTPSAPPPVAREADAGRSGGWRGGNGNGGNGGNADGGNWRGGSVATPPVVRNDAGNRRDGSWRNGDARNDVRNDGRNGRRDGWNGNAGNRGNEGWRGQHYRRDNSRNDTWRNDSWRNDGGRRGVTQRWDRNWRTDNRYDWQRNRQYNRNAYRLPRYYAPYGYNYGYRRFSIGLTLGSAFFGQNYWIDDVYDYRLPEVYPPYRWIRYYNDVLLVDTDSGQVVDVIYDFFW